MDIERIVSALKTVPAKQLRIIELTNELTGPDGQINTGALAARQPEINLAIAEAQAYGDATASAFDVIHQLMVGTRGTEDEYGG